MTDMQDRIERAADGCEARFREVVGDAVDMPSREIWLGYAEAALRLAFPELFDTPTHWIAPMEVNRKMYDAYVTALGPWTGDMPKCSRKQKCRKRWASMRTAYLNQKDSEGQ